MMEGHANMPLKSYAASLVASLPLLVGCGPKSEAIVPSPPPPPAAPAVALPPVSIKPASPRCPRPPVALARGYEREVPDWVAGRRIVRCPPDTCSGYASCVCEESGRMVSRTSHLHEHINFDEKGRPIESWSDVLGRRAHAIYLYSEDCLISAHDDDDDLLVDRSCRTPLSCDSRQRSCTECAPMAMELRSPLCQPGICPPQYSRCGCDDAGRIVELLVDAAHTRQTRGYDAAGRISSESYFRGEEPYLQRQTTFDDSGRVIELRILQGKDVTTTRTLFFADGGRRETMYSGDKQVAMSLYDRSTPGEERITITNSQGTTQQTVLLRKVDGTELRVPLTPPITEAWLTCRDAGDCTTVVDHCHCDDAYYVAKRYEQKLRGHLARGCKKDEPVACLAMEMSPPPPPRCLANLCVP